ncbi:MAG: hypothetical protein ACREK2_04640 [Gemmatimonadota bacterium]
MSPSPSGHALVIGGSGMLRWACTHLASRGAIVTVIARDRGRLDALAAEAAGMPGRIVPLSCDYENPERLTGAIDGAAHELGRPDPTIVWMRRDARESLHAAARTLDGGPGVSRFVHVLPSAARSRVVRKRLRDEFAPYPWLRYRQVVLGFMIDDGVSRWLTDTEISDGVLRSLEHHDDEFIVGKIHPWSERPGV